MSITWSTVILTVLFLFSNSTGCRITCHQKCRHNVVLDCRGPLKLQARMSRSDAGTQSWDVDMSRETAVSEVMTDSEKRMSDRQAV